MARCQEMKKFLIAIILIMSFAWAGTEKELAEKYRKWLEVVYYHITPAEREAFFKLKTDRERDLFIKAFWKHRDPTPETPENEFKEELYRRFEYVNRYFGRGTVKPGWKTDRGKIYMLLGPPFDIERINMPDQIYPAEIWYYHGNQKNGLPPIFGLIFYQKGGTGEYVLYNPAAQSPVDLVVNRTTLDVTNVKEAYRIIAEVNPELASLTLNPVPAREGEPLSSYLDASLLFQKIFELPLRQVDDSYARHFLEYRGMVDVEYSTNYVEAQHRAVILWNPALRMHFINYMVRFPKMSIATYRGKAYISMELVVKLETLEGKPVLQITKQLSSNLSRYQMRLMDRNGCIIADMVPIIPGEFRAIFLVKNKISKEFTYFEEVLEVPEPVKPSILSAFVAYSVKNYYSTSLKPFVIGNSQFKLLPVDAYSVKDKASLVINFAGLEGRVFREAKFKIDVMQEGKEITSKVFPLHKDLIELNYIEIPIELFASSPGEYEFYIHLLVDQKEADSTQLNLLLSPLLPKPKPVVLSKRILLRDMPVLLENLAIQHYNLGHYEDALKLLEAAYEKKPNDDLLYKQALCLMALGKPAEVLGRLAEIKEPDEKVLLLKARARESMGQLEKAEQNYRAVLSRNACSIEALRGLAALLMKQEKEEEARSLLEKSLQTCQDHPEIRKMLDLLNRE